MNFSVRINSPLRGAALFAIATLTQNAHAEITALELAETCARALAQSYVGLDAEACNWYVAPCPVCGTDVHADAEWCVPAGEPVTVIAARAAAALRARPDAAREAAKVAVKEILSRAYPCR